MNEGQAYLDIVWRQLRKNGWAYWSLWIVVGMFLLAIFAPLISSNVPLVFHDGSSTIYPWWHALFHADETVDFVFNMALLLFVPWLIVAALTNRRAKRRGVPGRRRLGLVLLEYLLLIAALCAYFPVRDAAVGWLNLPNSVARWIPALPDNPYGWRDFPSEQFRDPEHRWGIYPPLPFGPTELDVPLRIESPGFRLSQAEHKSNETSRHWLGTTMVGGDVLAQMIYGSRVSLTIGIIAVSIYATIGIVLGALAGYFGGWTDIVISRSIETVQMIPSFFLILIIVAKLGPSIYNIMIVIGITSWTGIARLTRGEFLKQRALDYTAAAQALGTSHLRIVFRHILPNSLSPALVAIPFGISDAIITEAGLSLLGFGIRPPAPSWGSLLNVGSGDYHNWWLVVFPSIAIFLTVTVFNLVGNGLRDAMDPRLRI